jgi:hypothetical protein
MFDELYIMCPYQILYAKLNNLCMKINSQVGSYYLLIECIILFFSSF